MTINLSPEYYKNPHLMLSKGLLGFYYSSKLQLNKQRFSEISYPSTMNTRIMVLVYLLLNKLVFGTIKGDNLIMLRVGGRGGAKRLKDQSGPPKVDAEGKPTEANSLYKKVTIGPVRVGPRTLPECSLSYLSL